MSYVVIDSEKPIAMFRDLLEPDHAYKAIRLIGGPNMGKSHLLRNVFPELARQHAHYALLDLSASGYTSNDALHSIRHQLVHPHGWPLFNAAQQKRLERNRVDISHTAAFFARTTISIAGSGEDSRFWETYLTSEFVADLGAFDDLPVVLLIDSVDAASETTQSWLMETLLVPFLELRRARVVLAGTVLPLASASYSQRCREYTLCEIRDDEAYINYCRQAGVKLVEQSIRDFACACDYRPGLFVSFVQPKFGPNDYRHLT